MCASRARSERRKGRDYQIVSPGSPDFETASAIHALALAISAMRSARQGALCFSPPAATYRFAISLRARQFGEVSYFEVLSRTSMTQRLTAASSSLAIASSCESRCEQAAIVDARTRANKGTGYRMYGPGLSSSLLSENGCLKQLRGDSQPSERNHVLPRAGQALQAADASLATASDG